MNQDLRNELRGLADAIAASIVDDLERIVERHAVRLVAERLGTTLASKNNGTAPRAAAPRAGIAPRATAKQGDNRGRILAHVQAHPGERSEKVRAAVGLGRGQWMYAINRLIADRALERRGEKRASTLHPR